MVCSQYLSMVLINMLSNRRQLCLQHSSRDPLLSSMSHPPYCTYRWTIPVEISHYFNALHGVTGYGMDTEQPLRLQGIILCHKAKRSGFGTVGKRFDGIKNPQHHSSKSKKQLQLIIDNVSQGRDLHSLRPELHLESGRQTTTCSISGLFVRLEHSAIHLSQAVYQFVLQSTIQSVLLFVLSCQIMF